MAEYYADSSVLVKRHVSEVGSPWVSAITDPAAANLIITARITIAEVYSAFNRRLREHNLNVADYARIAADFEMFSTTRYSIVDLSPSVIFLTRGLLERYVLRAYDAVQLASAIEARRQLLVAETVGPVFLAADNRLLVAAQAEGFVVDNPNNHP